MLRGQPIAFLMCRCWYEVVWSESKETQWLQYPTFIILFKRRAHRNDPINSWLHFVIQILIVLASSWSRPASKTLSIVRSLKYFCARSCRNYCQGNYCAIMLHLQFEWMLEIGDAGSTADIRMLWSAMVCYSLLWMLLVWLRLAWLLLALAPCNAGCRIIHFIDFHQLSCTFIHFCPLSSIFIHFIHFYPLSSTFIHFHPLSSMFI